MSSYTTEDFAAAEASHYNDLLCTAAHLQGRLESRIAILEAELASCNRHNANLHIENEEKGALLEKLCDRKFYSGSMSDEDHARDVEEAVREMWERIAAA